jgi:ketosteroid isomerase-like protein
MWHVSFARFEMKRADSPEQLHPLFAEALNRGDADALAALYADDACLWARNDEPVRGTSQRGALLAGYCAMKATMQITTRKSMIVGDTALLMSDWRMTGTAADGSPIDASGTSVEVAKRGPDGAWRYLIDLPHGIAT